MIIIFFCENCFLLVGAGFCGIGEPIRDVMSIVRNHFQLIALMSPISFGQITFLIYCEQPNALIFHFI